MIEMGIEDKKKGPALNERTARSVKLVAGARNRFGRKRLRSISQPRPSWVPPAVLSESIVMRFAVLD